MFGKYNDSILKKIGNRQKDNNFKGLKKDIKEYVTLIKEDKNLNEFFKIYVHAETRIYWQCRSF